MRVIGTAGHVDHGKSTLIQALTGIDPDRLPEEKERGMTIDLGFAWLRQPNGAEVSIVDVPGHERFIHNMLAGIGGIDIALLVIAADEGVMAQTREHVAILDLLGVHSGVVALTKCDLVDQDWLDLVAADVEDFLSETSLSGVSIIPCSSTSGAGLPDLVSALEQLLGRQRARPDSGRPRLPIDRVFTVAGFGTVVTGTLLEGQLKLGQEIEVQPGGLRARVRGLQTHRKKMETVPSGTRCAVNLTGVSVEDLRRGQVITLAGALPPTRAVDARVRLIKDGRPLRHNAAVNFHSGAAETLARVSLLDADVLEPGKEGWVQIRLAEELALVKGDLFVLRLPSPSMTLGGGTVVEAHARRHRRRHQPLLTQLAVLAEGTPEEIVMEQLRAREPAELAELTRRCGLPAEEVRGAVQRLLADGAVLELGATQPETSPRSIVVTTSGWRALVGLATAFVEEFHRALPLRRGPAKEELRARLGSDPRLFARELQQLIAEGILEEDGPIVCSPNHRVEFTPRQARQVAQLLALLRQARAAPPDRPDWQSELGIDTELVDAMLARGTLVEMSPVLVYDSETLAGLIERIRDAITSTGPLSVAQIRDCLDASRKYVLPIVAYTDQRHITKRVGDLRSLY